jgi:Secretion system C-terminal sorting domain
MQYESRGQVIQSSKNDCFTPNYSFLSHGTLCEELTQNGWTPTNTLPNGWTFASSIFPAAYVYDRRIVVPANATFVIDNFKTFVRCSFSMSDNSTIQILQGAGTSFYSCNFFSCIRMWNGIVVTEGATGFTMGGCKIEDAHCAVTLADGVKSKFYDNRFNRNWDGIQNKNDFTGVSGVSLTKFSNNTFDTEGAFLNAPHGGQIGNTGLNLTQVVASFGSKTEKNFFLNLNRGIISKSSDLKILNCDFTGNVSEGIYVSDGSLTVTKSRFHNCRGGGINAESANLNVTYSTFSGNSEVGILSGSNLAAERIYIKHNTFDFSKPEFHLGSIWLDRSLAGVNTTSAAINSVSQNNFSLDPATGIGNIQTVVLVSSVVPAKDWMDISLDTIEMIGGAGAAVNGIWVSPQSIGNGYRVLNNIIDCNTSNVNGEQNGILMEGGAATSGQMISHNQVFGSGTTQSTDCAIRVTRSEGVLVCDNFVDRFARGFSFLGKNSGMTFRSNTIRRHKEVGLEIAPNFGVAAEIGIQTLNSNFWSATQSDYPVLAASLAGDIPASQFFVYDMTNPAETPPKRSMPATWFQAKVGNFNQCDDQILTPNPKISLLEREIMQKTANNTDLPAWQFFEYRRGIYEKLLQNPDLSIGDVDATYFWNSWTNTNIEKFARVQNLIYNSVDGIGNLQNQLEIVRANQWQKSAELAILEANIDVSTITDAFFTAKKLKLEALAQLNDQERSIRSLIRTNVATALDQAIGVNNIISPVNAWETHRKTLNFLRIKRIKGQPLSNSEVVTLEFMANLPIEQTGFAKSEAVKLLPLCKFKQLNAAAVVQHGNAYIQPQKIAGSTINVYPNPTSDKINVEFAKSATGILQIVSITGTVMSNQTIREANQTILDLTTFESGIYFVRFQAENGIITTKKIIITR